MAEENKPDPLRGTDEKQSWQPSHIDNEGAVQDTDHKESTDQENQNRQESQEEVTSNLEHLGTSGSGSSLDSGADGQARGQRSDPASEAWNGASNSSAQSSGQQETQQLSSSTAEGRVTGQTGSSYGQGSQNYYRPAPLYGAYAPSGQPVQRGQGNQNSGQGQQPGYGQQTQGNVPSGNGSSGGPYPGYGRPNYTGSPNQGQGPIPPNMNTPGAPGNAGGGSLSGTGRYVFTAVVAALVAAALMLGLGWAALSNGWVSLPSASNLSGVSSNSSGQGTAKVEGGKSPDWQAISKEVSASVVSIQTKVKDGIGAGSGAVIDDKGHIVTNNHVVDGAQQISVTLSNGQMYSAKVVGTDTTADLAVIILENPPSDLKPVQYADSDKLAVGENVMAIGNPLGYENTATTGIVSALNRPVSVMDESNNNPVVTNAVQLDAAINPGNSGGPTFNAAGQVIGINSSIASMATSQSEAGSIGIGFAIPSNLVKRISEEIINDGKAKHVSLGVTIQSSTVEADGVTRGGAKVTKVVSGSPADKAGIKTGDTIVAFNGNAVNNNYSLLGYVRAAAYGSSAKITVVRDKKAVELNATLDQEEQAVQGKPKSNRKNSQGDDSDQGNSGKSDDDSTDPFEYFFGR